MAGSFGSCMSNSSNPDWFFTTDFYPHTSTFLVSGTDDPVHSPAILGDPVEDDLTQILIHELGHVLGFDHPSGFEQFRSIMRPGQTVDGLVYSGGNWPTAHHLFPYDKDCADDFLGVRSLRYAWRGWDPLPAPGAWSLFGLDDPDWRTIKGITASGALRSSASSTSSYYGLFRAAASNPLLGDSFRSAAVGTDGYIPFGTSYAVTGSTAGLPAGTYLAPQLMSPWERIWNTGNNARLNFTRAWTDPAMSGNPLMMDAEDPPRWESLRSNDLFQTGTFNLPYRYNCDSSMDDPDTVFPSGDGFCIGSYKTLASHVPIGSAWDPASNQTLFVAVDTQRKYRGVGITGTAVEKERVDANGRIFIIPGFESPLVQYSLNRPTYLPKWPKDCSDPAQQAFCDRGIFRYEQETESGPGMACAPAERGFTVWGQGPYNCLLAWADRGSPQYRILYTYFRIINNVSGRPVADFWPGSYVLEGANTVGNVTAAWFGDSFHLAWKSLGTSSTLPQVRRAHNATTGMIGWTVVSGGWGTEVIDSPTFVYDPITSGREAGLIWTQAD